jgi:hypothetical protein
MKKEFTITLKENGIHSLSKGLDTFSAFEQSKNEYLLKESIMFLHHGIELLLKQILVEKAGEYLIYADISEETIRKVIKAKKQNISVFDLPKPPHTATYLEVLGRVRAFVNDPELTERLETWLKELNSIRNNIEHYAINEEIQKTEELLVKIRKPLLNFFKKSIQEFDQAEGKQVSKRWGGVSNNLAEYKLVEKEVLATLQQFHGQKIPGELLSTTGEIVLPVFSNILQGYRLVNERYEIDILGENDNEKWIFEIKMSFRTQHIIDALIYRMKTISTQIGASTSWVIVFDEVSPRVKTKLTNEGIYISSIKEWNKIQEIVVNASK